VHMRLLATRSVGILTVHLVGGMHRGWAGQQRCRHHPGAAGRDMEREELDDPAHGHPRKALLLSEPSACHRMISPSSAGVGHGGLAWIMR